MRPRPRTPSGRDPKKARALPRRALLVLAAATLVAAFPRPAAAQPLPVVPKEQRGRFDAERAGTHDAANIRTVFWNFGMVGDYPPDPGHVNLNVFHSAEAPSGSGLNYSD